MGWHRAPFRARVESSSSAAWTLLLRGTSSVKSSIPGMGSFIYFFSTSSTKAPSRGTMSSIFFYFFAAWFIFFFSRRDACNFIFFSCAAMLLTISSSSSRRFFCHLPFVPRDGRWPLPCCCCCCCFCCCCRNRSFVVAVLVVAFEKVSEKSIFNCSWPNYWIRLQNDLKNSSGEKWVLFRPAGRWKAHPDQS